MAERGTGKEARPMDKLEKGVPCMRSPVKGASTTPMQKQGGTTAPSDGQGVSTTHSQEQRVPTTPSQRQGASTSPSQGQNVPGTPSPGHGFSGTTYEQGASGGTSATVSLKPFCRMVACGSTHGNERPGLFLVKGWLKDPSELQRQSFSGTPYLVNPRASESNRRYTEKDINTCFAESILSSQDSENAPYEVTRAKEINRLFGPKGSAEAYDLMLDMHTSSCNMGACIIIDNAENYFAMHLARYVQKHFRFMKISIYLHMRPKDSSGTITSIARCGITLEMGPVGLETLRADAYLYMKALVNCCLDFTDQFNQGGSFPAFEVEAYQYVSIEPYPKDKDGEISAMVHPNFQDQDFVPLKPGDPIFQTFDGKDILFSGDKTIYPLFVNDTGMFLTKQAFVNTDKLKFRIPAIQASEKCGDVHAKAESVKASS